MDKQAIKNPFEGREEVKTTEFKKWDYEEVPAITGVFKGETPELTNKEGEKFTALIFKHCRNAATGEFLGTLNVPKWGKLKYAICKSENGIGSGFGIHWQGKKTHPKEKKKTMNIVAVFKLDEKETQELINSNEDNTDLPF
jgi:hypothetical protein